MQQLSMGRGWKHEAKYLFNDVLNVDPTFGRALNNLATLHCSTGEVDIPDEMYKRSLNVLEQQINKAEYSHFVINKECVIRRICIFMLLTGNYIGY